MRTVAAVSLALIIGIWSLATLLIEAIGAPVRALAERVETGPPRKWAFFTGMRRMDTASGAMTMCPRESIRSAVSIELAALDAAHKEGKLREWELELAAADRLLRHGLRCFPYDGNMWLRLAMVEFARTGPTKQRRGHAEIVGRCGAQRGLDHWASHCLCGKAVSLSTGKCSESAGDGCSYLCPLCPCCGRWVPICPSGRGGTPNIRRKHRSCRRRTPGGAQSCNCGKR